MHQLLYFFIRLERLSTKNFHEWASNIIVIRSEFRQVLRVRPLK